MVSQNPNDEWEAPCISPASIRTPPSYVDAVRNRHSLTQSEPFKLVTDRSMQYNSLPRPLPQRLQACNGMDAGRNQWTEPPPPPDGQQPHQYRLPKDRAYQPVNTTHGFQVYSRPPGPANHVPLSPSSSTSSLPRHFPRNRRPEPPAMYNRDLQMPLSIQIQQNNYPKKMPIKEGQRSHFAGQNWAIPNGRHDLPPPPPSHRDIMANRNGSAVLSRNSNGDHNKIPSITNGAHPPQPYYPQQYQQHHLPPQNRDHSQRFNSPRYSRNGLLQTQEGRRQIVPEPAVSLRTGPLGSYPDSLSFNSSPPPSSPPKKQGFSPVHTRNKDYHNTDQHHLPRRQDIQSNSSCPLYENHEEVLQNMALQKSATLPMRHPPVDNATNGQHYESNGGLYANDQQPRVSDMHLFSNFSPGRNMCNTPEEAGLVMIVESSRDTNKQMPKDLVKPTPRIPMSPTGSLSLNSNGYHNEDRSPLRPYQNGIHTNPESSRANGIEDMSRCLPLKSLSGPLLRRTPLSSSTASLSSEISSVSSRNRPPVLKETAQKRLSANLKFARDSSGSGDKDNKKEISPSPWTREEREKLQKQQMEGARRVRDDEIGYLETLRERTSKQDEWLRILLLEREFQRRVEEAGDDDDEEEDESLLERAETRERMLMMERDKNGLLTNVTPSQFCNNNNKRSITSSSDHWLLNSQARQRQMSNDSSDSPHNTSGSFEVEQLNDLLETMNMSPVSRESSQREQTNKISPSIEQENSLSKTIMKMISSSPVNTNDVYPIDPQMNQGSKYHNSRQSNESLAPRDIPVVIDSRIQPKLAARVALPVATKPKSKKSVDGNSFHQSLTSEIPRNYHMDSKPISNGTSTINDIHDKQPLTKVNGYANKSINGFQKETEALDNQSPEYKKIWTSKPEKLTFLDKIKKFSIQAGEDDIPRDRVKNSRAQRELETKFYADPTKAKEQKVA